MNSISVEAGFSRRSFLVSLVSLTSFGFFGLLAIKGDSIAKAAPFVKPKERWTADHFYDFLKALPADEMLALKKALGLLSAEADKKQLKGNDQDARDIQKYALKLSSNILLRPFRDEKKLNYHSLVTWVCDKAEISKTLIQVAPTFVLERELYKPLFADKWDKLTLQQRKDLLEKIDSDGEIVDKTAIAALGGAAALAILSTTVAFKGFAFYTAMSTAIATAAGLVSVTLPFAAYTAASTLVGILSGPAGWAIIGGLTVIGGTAFVGRADPLEATKLVNVLHMLKVKALAAAKVPEEDVFSI